MNQDSRKNRGRFKRRRSAAARPDLEAWSSKLEFSTSGGALVMVLLIVCVLSAVAASILLGTTARYHTTYQSASWQEAIVGAEAGIDLAMTELRKRVVSGPSNSFKNRADALQGGATAYWVTTQPNGKAYANYGHALSTDTQPYLLALASHGGEGNTSVQARVFVDVPGSDAAPTPQNFAVSSSSGNNSYISQFDNPALRDPDGVDRSRWWYRIRALGIANVSGPPRPSLEKLDNRLRHFSMFNDWRTGDAVSTPQVSRLVEVLVQPQTNFRNALMADKQINLSNQDVLVDSYDSSKGIYSTLNVGNQGNIATNGQLINANHATVNGNALTNNGTVDDGDHVTGQQSGNFYQELTPFTAGLLNPAWSGVKDGGTLTNSATYTASTDSTNPTLVRLDGINLSTGGKVINVAAPADKSTPASPSYIKIYVQGDITTAGTSFINLDPSVNAIVYFTGNLNLQGSGIINNSFLARQLVLNGIQPAPNRDGSTPARSINIATTQDFEGVVYAPDHDLNLALQAVPTDPASTVVNGTAAQILLLQSQIALKQLNVTGLQADYDREYALYLAAQNGGGDGDDDDDGGGRGKSHLKKAQQDQVQITQIQSQIETLNQQLLTLGGLNPKSSADDHARGYNGIYGGFIGKTITVANKTHVHYDETLRDAGPVNHYRIVNWFEDGTSRNAATGPTAFWWTGAK